MLFKFLLLLCSSGIALSQNAPVFLWGSSNTPFRPALKTLNSNDFTDIILPNLKDAMLLVFLEENLQSQDFSQCKLKSGETCFANLKTYTPKTFYADVEDPVQSVKSLIEYDIEFVQIKNKKNLPKSLEFKAGKIVIISFEEKLTDRSQTLIEHDSIMAHMYGLVKDEGKVFAMYTSEENSQVIRRTRRQVAPNTEHFDTKDEDITFWANFEKININAESIKVTAMKIKKADKAYNFTTTLTTTAKGDITFDVNIAHGYWYITEFKYDGEVFVGHIESSIGFSYYCGNIIFKEKTNKVKLLHISLLQVQPFYKVNAEKFADPWHCTGFISGGIISGLFVTFMLIIIMSIGITWLLDIRTMDRFDDPKGKTITINVTD